MTRELVKQTEEQKLARSGRCIVACPTKSISTVLDRAPYKAKIKKAHGELKK